MLITRLLHINNTLTSREFYVYIHVCVQVCVGVVHIKIYTCGRLESDTYTHTCVFN